MNAETCATCESRQETHALEAASRTLHPDMWEVIDTFPTDPSTMRYRERMMTEIRYAIATYQREQNRDTSTPYTPLHIHKDPEK